MDAPALKKGIHAGRLGQDELREAFADLHPPLDDHEAIVDSERCYFCHDAPCVTACPTAIDIPLFIRQISTGMPTAAAKTILSQNILGGMCARVCPTETLCEQACVREAAEGKPVIIGRLQRYATDRLMDSGLHPFTRGEITGKRIAVIGAGPAGLACAHRLAMHGHDVTVFDARKKAGGLNEYGIASYKTVNNFAASEIEWLLKIGGITIETGKTLGRDFTLDGLMVEYDAVFLGIGLGGVNALEIDGENSKGISNAVDFIAELRQAKDLGKLPVGRDVVVIGGGMTAIDAAVQAKLLGALNVSIVYRRGRDRMGASVYEQELAASKGVRIITNAVCIGVAVNGSVTAAEFEYVDDDMKPSGERFTLTADQIFKAIGQTLAGDNLPELDGGKIKTDKNGRTSIKGVWAGGDCVAGGDDLTVTAVAQGRDAAEDITNALA